MRLARLNCRAKARLLQNQRIHVELDLGQRGGEETKKPSVPKRSEGLRKLLGNSASSLAVFYVEQVALNRHVLSVALTQSESRSPQPRGTLVYARARGRSQILNLYPKELLKKCLSSSFRAVAQAFRPEESLLPQERRKREIPR